MRLASKLQLKEIESRSTEHLGLSEELLIEAAATAASLEIKKFIVREKLNGSVLVLCGPGNNGADGLAVARHLSAMGFSVTAHLDPESKLRDSVHFKRAQAHSIGIDQNPLTSLAIIKYGLVVDAFFGIGLSRPLATVYLDFFAQLNSLALPVVALDVPSGLDAESGMSLGGILKAQMTLSFGRAKPGFFVNHGPENYWATQSAYHRVRTRIDE